eukprot:g4745.t2
MAESKNRQRLPSGANKVRWRREDLTKNLPAPVLLSLLEWLAIPDLLAVGAVDCGFRDLTTKEPPWKAAAQHLWKSALLDGQQSHFVEAAGVHETARAANVTLQDICRSMVGAWPTYIDDIFRTRPDTLIQASIDGVIQPFSTPLDMVVETSPMLGGGSGGGGGGGGGGRSSNGDGCNDDGCSVSKKNTGLCSGVVFRGALGGGRAVRANVPFPFMGTMETHRDGARFKPSEKDLTHGCVVLTAQTVYDATVRMHYPDEFLARVKADAPFSLLWPGHHAPDGKDPSSVAPPGSVGGSSGGSGAGTDGAADLNPVERQVERRLEELRLELERLPSSGPAPFFHAGYTAYFEITLGKTVPPLHRQEGDEIRSECVAIGLANGRFPSTKQPGWDCNSWGLHSDDGWCHHAGRRSDGSIPVKFGPGDTVGCGLLYPRGLKHFDRRWASGRTHALPACKDYRRGGDDGAIFFTKNGRFLRIAFRQVIVERPLYPVIGLDSHCLVTANFGAKAFAFDVPAFESWFTGTKLNCYAPSAPEEHDERAIMKTVYSGRNGFINPRLLCPYLRLTDVEEREEMETEEERYIGSRVFVPEKYRRLRLWYNEWHERQRRNEERAFTPTRNFFSGAALNSESKILRESTSRYEDCEASSEDGGLMESGEEDDEELEEEPED